jgi:hypothetical protein
MTHLVAIISVHIRYLTHPVFQNVVVSRTFTVQNTSDRCVLSYYWSNIQRVWFVTKTAGRMRFKHNLDDDHDNGVRLRPWTTATTVHSPGDMWAWRNMVEWYGHGKAPAGRSKWSILSTKYFFHDRRDLLHAVKSFGMGPTAFLPLQRKSCYGLCRP